MSTPTPIEVREGARVVHTIPNTKSVRIRFDLEDGDIGQLCGDHNYFDVWIERGQLHVRALRSIAVLPCVSNEVALVEAP